MEDRLRNLKKAMDRSEFDQLAFTEQHRKAIREKIKQQDESEDQLILALLQLLSQEKTGFELVKLIQARGLRTFDDNEGFLYTLLHRLEKRSWIESFWLESDAKFYQLTNKGKKVLQKAEKGAQKNQIALAELLGVRQS